MRPGPAAGVLAGLVLAISSAPAQAADSGGDVTFSPPLRITGHSAIASADGALYVTLPAEDGAVAGDAGLDAQGTGARLTLVTWDIENVGTTVDGREVFVERPSDPPHVETWDLEAATVRIGALRPSAEILVGAEGPLELDGTSARSVAVERHDEEFRVDDFQRSGSDIAGEPSEPWHFTYQMQPPYFGWSPGTAAFSGAGTLYAWEADVEVCAPECQAYPTGRSLVESDLVVGRTDRFVWLFATFADVQGSISPSGAEVAHYSRVVDVAAAGTVELPRAQGGLRIGDRAYVASGGSLVLDGDVRLLVSPGAAGGPAGRRADADLSGDIKAINLEALAATSGAAPANARPVLLWTLAAILVLGAGVVVATRSPILPSLLRERSSRRNQRDLAEVDTTADPLLHPDRHRIYYLLQRRGVLTAAEAETTLGVWAAARHMDLLADAGLIRRGVVERSGRRLPYYAFPGREFEDRAERLLLLGDSGAARLAELLDMYGEVEADTLTEAARRAAPHLAPQRTRALLDVFRSAGLVREETVAGVAHVAPTAELRTCLFLHSGRARTLRPA